MLLFSACYDCSFNSSSFHSSTASQVPSNLKLSLLLFTFFFATETNWPPKDCFKSESFFLLQLQGLFPYRFHHQLHHLFVFFPLSQKSRIPEVVSVTCSRNSLLNTHPNITLSSVPSNKNSKKSRETKRFSPKSKRLTDVQDLLLVTALDSLKKKKS